MRQIAFAPTFTHWQAAARVALREELEPELVHWEELNAEQPALDLSTEDRAPSLAERSIYRVPRAFVGLARRVACHRDPRRWSLLYRVLWRLTHGEPKVLEIVVDPEVHELLRMEKAVRHDVHKMRAFVRFREVPRETAGGDTSWFVAWFEPENHIVELNAPFFVDRFAGMLWSILTPERCAHWDGNELRFTAGVSKAEAPTEDRIEALWLEYYAHIFNPGRVKVPMMKREMPVRYWKNLPETATIPALLKKAPARVQTMLAASAAQHPEDDDWHPASPPPAADLAALRDAAAGCTACPLYKNATQTVFGEGPRDATVVLLGEQPGDQEDRAGHPFVGPAGQLLDRALAEAGIERQRCYVTNVVKHFKWEPRGKRRLHKTPNSRDVAACRPWMEAELAQLKSQVLVCLGSTAARAIFGAEARVLRDRGRLVRTPFAEQTLITVHPSSLLRAPDEMAQREQYAHFVEDLVLVAKSLRISPAR